MNKKALYPAILVYVFISLFMFFVVYEYEIISFLYPEYAVRLHVPFASGFSISEKIGLNIIMILIPTVPAIITFLFEYSRLKNSKN